MQQIRLALLLLQPSILSALICCIVSALFLVGANRWYLTSDPAVYQALYGFEASVKLQTTGDVISSYASAFSGRYISYELIVFVLALGIGFSTYGLLQGLSRSHYNILKAFVAILSNRGETRADLESTFWLRVFVRILAVIAWFMYWLFSQKVLVPYTVLASRGTFEDFFINYGWLCTAVAVAVLAIGIHFHLVFMRLVLLRPRLFGGEDAIRLTLLQK